MNISSRCEYACRAIIELALNANSEQPVTALAIANKRNIPGKYLVHILIQLKRAGIVRSVRGAQGGYILCRPPGNISLLDIIEAIEGPIIDLQPIEGHADKDVAPIWKDVACEVSKVLKSYRVQDIIDNVHESDMYYI
ncbi:MAG TPA: Rrf2 family transcriptional regulator [Candidatus Hydrogenedentes bacterium]|nr:Rrf2 family transcriptional regulator [Candidatus Hydrogenedentota bacterium]HQH52957.1 Rrf2 family transcriptional regulator [Candidatus Hydrogenedentota bacterium]